MNKQTKNIVVQECITVQTRTLRCQCPGCGFSAKVKHCHHKGQTVGECPEKQVKEKHKGCKRELVWTLLATGQEAWPIRLAADGRFEFEQLKSGA